MIEYWNIKDRLAEQDFWSPNSWVQITHPDAEDTRYLVDKMGIPEDFMPDIEDRDERPRYDIEDGWMLIILRIPYYDGGNLRTPHTTVPLVIMLKGDKFITVCNTKTEMMPDFITFHKRRGCGFTDTVDLIFRLFLSSAVWYLKYLKQISAMIEQAKSNLYKSVNNTDLIRLSSMQDSLTYFITSMRGNETLLQRVKLKLPVDELDADLIEDVNIEMTQAREMTNIYTNILDSTMDTYASIINNNMSDVMKTLTSVSILLMFPTLVSSFLGMNVPNFMETSWWAFPALIAGTMAVTLGILAWFRHKHWI